MFSRNELSILANRLAEPRRFMQVIMGPRQVGKTTLVGQLVGQTTMPTHYVSADNAGQPITRGLSSNGKQHGFKSKVWEPPMGCW
jgi:predicted AAA+ superfamily ATPase